MKARGGVLRWTGVAAEDCEDMGNGLPPRKKESGVEDGGAGGLGNAKDSDGEKGRTDMGVEGSRLF